MGIKPVVLLMVGFKSEDVERSRIVEWDEIFPGASYNPYKNLSNKHGLVTLDKNEIGNLIWYGAPMSHSIKSPGDYVGYIVDRIHAKNEWAMRGLLWLPESDNIGLVFPVPLDDGYQKENAGWRSYETIVAENRHAINFGGGYGLSTTDVWWQFAVETLRFAGWDEIERTNLRLYVVMNWS